MESEVGGAKEERYQTSPIPDAVHVGELPVGRKLAAWLYDKGKDQKMLRAVTIHGLRAQLCTLHNCGCPYLLPRYYCC